MTSPFFDAMQRATDAVRDGDPRDATRLIQEALTGKAMPSDAGGADDFDGVTIEGAADAAPGATNARAKPPPSTIPMLSQSYRGPAGARDYRVFLPPQGESGVRGLILMLHGCTQNPDDFARGTAINAIAAREGLIVVYPGQTAQHNPNSCWNWFEPAHQRRGAGEPAILAGLVQEVARTHGVPTGAIFAAGLSAGGAMAALLGVEYADVFGAVGVHSGLPAGAAQDIPSAFAAMQGKGQQIALAPDAKTPPARMMIVHGAQDRTVAATNGAWVYAAMRQAYPKAVQHRARVAEPGMTRLRLVLPDGTVVAEHWEIASLGHAWSGGDRAGSYTAPQKPDASEGFVRFFLDRKG